MAHAQHAFRHVQPSASSTDEMAGAAPNAPNEREAHLRKERGGNMCGSCPYLLGRQSMCPKADASNPGHSDRHIGSSRQPTSNAAWEGSGPSRTTSSRPKLPFGGTPMRSPRGSPLRGSAYGVVTPSSRGSPLMHLRDIIGNDRQSPSVSGSTPPKSTSPA